MQLNHKVFGNGHPLLIMHGLYGMLDNWQTLARTFAEDHMVYLVDAPNHGKSPEIPLFTYPIVSEVFYEFLESHWVHEAYVLGHSMGGKIAMQMALSFPDLIDKLVVIDISPKQYYGGHRTIFDTIRNLHVENVANRKEIKHVLMETLDDPAVVLFLMKNLRRRKTGGYNWKFNLEGLYRDYDHILAPPEGTEPYDKPVLFIRGGRSPYMSDDDLPTIRSLFPNAEVKTIYDAGHWVHADQPEQLASLVSDFLNN